MAQRLVKMPVQVWSTRIPAVLSSAGSGSLQRPKEVAFVFILLYHFKQAHFVMFSGLLGPLSIKLLYNTAYFFFFKIWTHFATKIFAALPNLQVWKIENLSNSIDVRLVPCLVECMIS